MNTYQVIGLVLFIAWVFIIYQLIKAPEQKDK